VFYLVHLPCRTCLCGSPTVAFLLARKSGFRSRVVWGWLRQLGNVEYARPRKFREKLGQWLQVVKTMWPECPARLSADGRHLNCATSRSFDGEECLMAASSFVPPQDVGARIRIAEIDSLVSARLGPTRGLGNSQPACFNRQIAMYLAARVGRWSTTAIGHFYNGRDHSTVCHAIARIESFKETNPEVDGLLFGSGACPSGQARRTEPRGSTESWFQLSRGVQLPLSQSEMDALAKIVAAEILTFLKEWLDPLSRTQT
jgi:hypothetical protein